MLMIHPVTQEGYSIRLEPLSYTVMYSILAYEWPDVQQHLEFRLARHGGALGRGKKEKNATSSDLDVHSGARARVRRALKCAP